MRDIRKNLEKHVREYAENTRQAAEQATAEFRQHLRDVRATAQPLRPQLVSTTEVQWMSCTSLKGITDMLGGLGFEAAGVVAAKNNPRVVIAGFASVQHGVYASIPKVADQAFVSFTSDFADGSCFECSNMPVPREPPYPDWLDHRRRVGTPAQELWTYFLRERPPKTLVSVSPSGFANASMEQMFRYRAWMAERGGETREELAARFRAAGKLPEGAEGEEMLATLRNNELEKSLCNWWRLQPDAPCPLEQVMDSLVIIHDELSPDRLVNAYWCSTGDFRARATDFAGSPPRDSFARVVAQRGARLRKVLQKRMPPEADFYLPQ